MNFDLPWTTKALIFISSILISHGWLILLILLVLIVAGWFLLRVEKIHYYFDRILIRLPIIGEIVQGYNLANIFRTLGLMMKSGVSIVRSINITSHTTKNLVYRKQLDEISQRITKGETIASHLERSPKLFPSISTQMVSVGESTGQLTETFMYLAEMYEDDVDDLTKNLSTIVEPLLLVLMGLLVGFVAISIITPIYGITQHLSPH